MDISKHQLDYNFLVVDDEPAIVSALYRQFRKKYNVFTATSAKEALEVVKNHKIEVILSDQRMPGMSGVEFFSTLKSQHSEASKIILTGFADIKAVIEAINQGQVFRYVSKPWDPEELETIIKEAFEKYDLVMQNRFLIEQLKDINHNLEQRVQDRTNELHLANNNLRELNQEKNRYIGIVAHDLIGPIGLASGYAGLILSGYQDYSPEMILKFCENIKLACDRSVDLITDVLDISKIEAGKFDLRIEEADYVKILQEAILINSLLAKEKNINIVFNPPLNPVIVQVDSAKIGQVISNLLSNAIKYSYPNTSIIIEVAQKDVYICTSVEDQGQGIPPKELKGIFAPFSTTSVRPTGNEKSTGLGLAIVHKIVLAHKGEVSVQSEVGKGTRFTFGFPVNTDTAAFKSNDCGNKSG